MIRTQIQLEQSQYERLKALAARRDTSIAQIVREGVEQVLASEQSDAAWDRFMAAAGCCRSADGPTDVSTRHDEYLADVFG
ncbi:MAG: ribbon-helix-helix domain-containing protein [Gammaproteobacteria bacterium]|nr:ribbon-helix-helix domain-containing protein [Gammaproteobacteria bacterium]